MKNKMDKELKKNMVIGAVAGISGALAGTVAGIILGSKLSRDYNIMILSNITETETESLDEDNIDEIQEEKEVI